ncbi:MAG: hypothetical protein R2786_07550 [Flavobacteriaceae bacterium]
MKFLKLFPIVIICFMSQVKAQESNNTIESQFTDIIEKSNRYEDYKVVKITKLNTLQKNVSDSITGLKSEIATLQQYRSKQQSTIDSLSREVASIKESLAISQKKENGITFFGTIITKSVYQTIMWGIVAALLLGLLLFIFKFKNSNAITREANKKLTDTETEFDKHRQNALEREQQLRRKLQDEINKQKKD